MKTFLIPVDNLNVQLLDRHLTKIMSLVQNNSEAFGDTLTIAIVRDAVAVWAECGLNLPYDRFCAIYPDGDEVLTTLDPDGNMADLDILAVNEAEQVYADCVWCLYDQLHPYLSRAPETLKDACSDVSSIFIDRGDIVIQIPDAPLRLAAPSFANIKQYDDQRFKQFMSISVDDAKHARRAVEGALASIEGSRKSF